MMKLTNLSKRDRGIPCADATRVVAPGADTEISDDDLKHMMRFPMTQQWLDKGLIAIEGRAEAKSPARPIQTAARKGPDLPDSITGVGIEYEQRGSWFHLWVNGLRATDKLVRKAQAEEMAKEYDG